VFTLGDVHDEILKAIIILGHYLPVIGRLDSDTDLTRLQTSISAK
jgi:hypothetical protein